MALGASTSSGNAFVTGRLHLEGLVLISPKRQASFVVTGTGGVDSDPSWVECDSTGTFTRVLLLSKIREA